MLRLLLFVSLTSAITSHAQHRKVSDICAEKKMAWDSSLRVEYGEALFPLFVIDSTYSGILTFTSQFYRWNDSVADSAVWSQRVCYNFHFPGAMKDPFPLRPPSTPNNDLRPDSIPFCKPGAILSSEKMDRITRRKLHQPLSKCKVRPFTGDEWMDKSHRAGKRNNHAYLLVRCTVKKPAPFGGANRVTRSIVVDAHTGEMVGRKVKYKSVVCFGKFD